MSCHVMSATFLFLDTILYQLFTRFVWFLHEHLSALPPSNTFLPLLNSQPPPPPELHLSLHLTTVSNTHIYFLLPYTSVDTDLHTLWTSYSVICCTHLTPGTQTHSSLSTVFNTTPHCYWTLNAGSGQTDVSPQKDVYDVQYLFIINPNSSSSCCW